MMKTHSKKQYCLWLLIQPVQNVRHSFNGHILQISAQKILFLHDHKGKTVCRIHLCGSQHNATHAVIRTDVDLLPEPAFPYVRYSSFHGPVN